MNNKFYLFNVILVTFVMGNTYAQTHDYLAYVDLGLPSGTLWAICNVESSNHKYCIFIEDETYLTKSCNSHKGLCGKTAKQELQESISLTGTKWKWEDGWEIESEYYNVYDYIEFISDQKVYYESDRGPYGGNAGYYYYFFDGNKGQIFLDEEKVIFMVKTDDEGLPTALILEGELILKQVSQ